MGIIRGMARRNRLENPQIPISSPAVLGMMGEGNQSASGVSVTPEKALGLTAFWAGVQVISQTIAGLPCKTYKRTKSGRELAEDHHVYKLLQHRPNPMMTPFTFRETRTAHCLTWGNSYAEIEYDIAGRPIALWPLLPDRTGVEIDEKGNKVYHTVINNTKIYLEADRVLHVAGLGFDGLKGYNVVKVHRDSLGLSIAANEYGATFFGNSGRPSGIITKPGAVSPEERAQLRADWNQMHTGLTRAQRTAILWGGMEWKPMSLPPEEAQFLETRAIQVEEIARILNINPIFLQHFTKVTTWGSGVVQFLTAFAKFTILPWLEREEDALNYDLFNEQERGQFYVKYSLEQLMRGDPKMQAEILEIERRNGILNADEWRALNDEDPLPDKLGQDYYMPLNMAPVDKIRDTDDISLGRRTIQRTEKRSGIPYRDRLTNAHRAALEDAARRFVKRDAEALKKAASKKDLDNWIDEFYPGQQRYIEQTMLPVISALTTVIGEAAADEIGDESISMARFAQDYTANLARREVSSSIGQIRKKQEQIAEEDLEQVLIDLADEWEEKRPGKVAQNESVRASSGAARHMWAALGVAYLVWRANDGACDLCAALDGKRVGIDRYFVDEGTSVTADGVTPLTVSENVGGPPLHAGCQCGIEPD